MATYIQTKSFSLRDIDLDKELGIYTPNKPNPLPKRQPGLFIKGPIPLDWLKKANNLGGSTGLVAAMLWFYAGIACSKTIKLDSKIDDVTVTVADYKTKPQTFCTHHHRNLTGAAGAGIGRFSIECQHQGVCAECRGRHLRAGETRGGDDGGGQCGRRYGVCAGRRRSRLHFVGQ